MTNERKTRLREVLTDIAADAEKDAKALDGKPFDARTVAKTFGETLAMVHALANVSLALLEDTED